MAPTLKLPHPCNKWGVRLPILSIFIVFLYSNYPVLEKALKALYLTPSNFNPTHWGPCRPQRCILSHISQMVYWIIPILHDFVNGFLPNVSIIVVCFCFNQWFLAKSTKFHLCRVRVREIELGIKALVDFLFCFTQSANEL